MKEVKHILFTDKYVPKRRSEVSGNRDSVNSIIAYLNKFRDPILHGELNKSTILLHGPPGVGKTAAILAVVKSLNFDLLRVDGAFELDFWKINDFQNPNPAPNLLKFIQKPIKNEKIGKVIVIENVDVLSRRELSRLASISRNPKVPLILSASTITSSRFLSLKFNCEIREFRPLEVDEIVSILKNIALKESIVISDQILEEISFKSNGDIRWAINNFQSISIGKECDLDLEILKENEKQTDIRKFITTLFIEKDGEKAYNELLSLDITHHYSSSILFILSDVTMGFNMDNKLFIQQFEILGKADELQTRVIKKRIFTQQKHFFLLITRILSQTGTQLKELFYIPDWQLTVPSYWITLSRIRQIHRLAEKVGKKFKVSSRLAKIEILPFICVMFNSTPETATRLTTWLNLSKDDQSVLIGNINENFYLQIRMVKK